MHIRLLGKAKLSYILKLSSGFHHFPGVGSKQLCALVHLEFSRKAGILITNYNLHYFGQVLKNEKIANFPSCLGAECNETNIFQTYF